MTEPVQPMSDDWTRSVVRVGDGRGFVVQSDDQRHFVITAGHCLPARPSSHTGSYLEERTYAKLIGPLGRKPTVWCECIFVNPIADLAVLASPDEAELSHEAKRYKALVETTPPLPLGRPQAACDAWLLSIDRKWFRCRVTSGGSSLWIADAADLIRSGMAGSPIVSLEGAAIGVVCKSDESQQRGGPNPLLAAQLPVWLERSLRFADRGP